MGSSRNAIYPKPFTARVLYATSPMTSLGCHRKSVFCMLTCSPDIPFGVRKIYVEWRKLSMRLFNVQHAFKFVSIHAAHLSLCLGFEQVPERFWIAHIVKLPCRIACLKWIPLTYGSHAYPPTSCSIQIRIYYLTLLTLERAENNGNRHLCAPQKYEACVLTVNRSINCLHSTGGVQMLKRARFYCALRD